MLHLWNMNNGMVEDPPHNNYYFGNWNEFIASGISFDDLPVYWIWIDSTAEEYEDFEFEEDQLTLVYLSLAPCMPYVIRINVNKNEEKKIEKWLLKHQFLERGG
jgi:hypothetical protein